MLSVDGDYFGTLRITPQLGRGLRPEDNRPGSDAVIVLGHDLWQDEFGEDKTVIGRQVLLNNVAFTLVGVVPESFTGLDPFTRTDHSRGGDCCGSDALTGIATRLSATALGAAELDPRLVAAVGLCLLLVATAAALIPARSASRIDPQQSLRQE